MRDEWSKIQGRFVDLVVNASGEEQIDLLGRAIESNHPKKPGFLAKGGGSANATADLPLLCGNAGRLLATSSDCRLSARAPSHADASARISGVSSASSTRRSRRDSKIFSRSASDDDIYGPDRLWDYLRINLEPSILASPDGHRWALAMDALERCEAMGGGDLHIRLLKVIAAVDMFKDRSGLGASRELLSPCITGP